MIGTVRSLGDVKFGLAALAVVAALAPGATVRWFHSPTGNIECELRATSAYCQTFKPFGHVVLHTNGRLDQCRGELCVGNGPTNATTLAYGASVVVWPFRCTSLRTGMRCTVHGHGFLLSRTGVKRL